MFVRPIPPPKRLPDLANSYGAGSAYGLTVLRLPNRGVGPPIPAPALTPLPKRDVGAFGGASFAFYSGIFSPAKVPPEIFVNTGPFDSPSLGWPKGLVVTVLLAGFAPPPNLTPPKVPPDATVNFLDAPALSVEGLCSVFAVSVATFSSFAGVGTGYVAAPAAAGFAVDVGPLLKLPTSLNWGGLDGTTV